VGFECLFSVFFCLFFANLFMLLHKWPSSATKGFSQIWLQDK
jgi:uncharacterized membrane protein